MMDWEMMVEQYRAEAERYKQEANEAKNELKDFVTFSQQIEAELDKELNAANLSLSKREKEIAVLVQERDRYKEEAQRFRAEQYSKDMKLNDELQELRTEKENLMNAVHKLEQKNDDLERELRITCETLKDTEKKLNEELEMRALLTTELDSKEDLKVRCQRLEDEVRDLKLDSMVKDTKLSNSVANQSNGVTVTQAKHSSGNLMQMKNRRQNNGALQPARSVKNGLTSYDNYDVCVHDVSKKRLITDASSKGIGSRVNSLPPSLASSVSPVIVNLLETIQALEEKLLLLHPERRTNVENGFGTASQH
ncbi:nudE nuclear distribution [Loa loa]|uniref:NudE nuclear distribution n=1 Tax=Loa loa TaxID=7209 RepID=A0A1I7VI57_LOALO|nr:nudE nuclear distribution [Loa loa]EFO22091.1 nudE nuclear distribution [Loa loa]